MNPLLDLKPTKEIYINSYNKEIRYRYNKD